MAIAKVFSLLLLICLLRFDHVVGQSQEQLQLIDEVIEKYMTLNEVIGYGLSVVQNGEIILSKGYGKADIAKDVDIQENTLFAVGSISKTLTSLLAVKVLSEKFPELGEAVLDTPISKLDKTLNFTLSDRYRTEAASLRDLLSHRTCLSNDDIMLLFQGATYDELSYRKRYDLEICSFRTEFSYNNGLIQLAGSLLAKIDGRGKEYPELMAELFAQIGMNSSRILDAEGSNEDLPNMSRAYTRIGDELVQFDPTHLRKASVVGGGGAVISTPTDMAYFLKFMLSGGQVDGSQVIPTNVLNWMQTVVLPFDFDAASGTGAYGYGLGLIMAMLEGAPWVKHNGFFAPYESALNMFTLVNNTHIGIFGSANGPGGTTGATPDHISQDVAHVMIKEILEGEVSTSEQIDMLHKKISSYKALTTPSIDIESHSLSPQNVRKSMKLIQPKANVAKHQLRADEVVGSYGDPRNGDLTISFIESNETLRLNYGKWGIGNLIPRSDEINVYDVEWATTIYYDLYAFGFGKGLLPVPMYGVDFGEPDIVEFILFEIPELGIRYSFKFNRGETLDTLPEIPWSSESCGPEY